MNARITKRVLVIWQCFILLLFTASQTALLQGAWGESKTPIPAKKGATVLTKPASSKPAVPATAATGKLKAGSPEFLWKASSDSGATLYLLGTIHAVKSDFYPLPQEMEDALTKSRALMVEIDTSKTDPIKIQNLTLTRGVYGQADTLANHVSQATMNSLMNSGIDPKLMQSFMRMRPWLVGLMLVQTEMAKLGYSGKQAIDAHMISNARMQGKKVIGLETEEFQVGVLADIPEELQGQMLEKTLLDLKKLKTEAGDLMKAWKDGDEKAMDTLITKDEKEHPEFQVFQDKLIYDRNVTMADKLEAYLKGSDTFMVAVGSAHLVGDKGICALLRKKGYKVEQIKAGDKI